MFIESRYMLIISLVSLAAWYIFSRPKIQDPWAASVCRIVFILSTAVYFLTFLRMVE
jgi:hypothetical protein